MHVGRDSFARGQYHVLRLTEAVYNHPRFDCCWCGQEKKVLYYYEWESDTGKCPPTTSAKHSFCSFSCFKTFYGA